MGSEPRLDSPRRTESPRSSPRAGDRAEGAGFESAAQADAPAPPAPAITSPPSMWSPRIRGLIPTLPTSPRLLSLRGMVRGSGAQAQAGGGEAQEKGQGGGIGLSVSGDPNDATLAVRKEDSHAEML